MKSFLLFLAFSIGLLWAPSALANYGETIDRYQVDIEILSDSSIKVTEIIDYNYGANSKHGIYRDIPMPTRHISENPFEIKYVKVKNEVGKVYRKETSRQLNNFRIKIGDPNKYVSGIKTYIISYTVHGAFSFSENIDGFFWNALGSEWEVDSIENIIINTYLPESIDKDQVRSACYFGFRGSNKECQGPYYGVLGEDRIGNIEQVIFRVPKLFYTQGATVNLYFQKGIISEPPLPNLQLAYFKLYGPLILPILSFLLMLYFWYHHGRDPKGRGNIIVQYDSPKDMMPAEVGSLYDERVHSKDISAEIIHLAILGYIKITRIKKKHAFSKDDYVLEKLKEPADLPRHYQIKLMNKLFGSPLSSFDLKEMNFTLSTGAKQVILLSDLKTKSRKWMKEIESDIYKLMVKKKYFHKNPHKTRQVYMIAAVALIFSVKLFGAFAENVVQGDDLGIVIWMIALFTSLLIVIIFGMVMPKKTIKGVFAKEHILGLKEYIRVAEKHRIKFHNTPYKDPKNFEKLLPYAMAFGLEKEWAKQFEGIYNEEPNWYVGSGGGHFSASSFGSSLNGFRSSASRVASTSSSGGGSSGGGGGGGGGGSW
ncbi:MAG: DUF2207 domain-containing protein [Candidatus Komeilibacteria bacterium]|jgi:uncharacterized membrane protein|nr:DUF2207 domain-containing protein [Candidatus Komeilibacteria bacterium]MBT4447358.1 DUF2207 domain-containing protein [Candidatus Komeilibacteria bacterium]